MQLAYSVLLNSWSMSVQPAAQITGASAAGETQLFPSLFSKPLAQKQARVCGALALSKTHVVGLLPRMESVICRWMISCAVAGETMLMKLLLIVIFLIARGKMEVPGSSAIRLSSKFNSLRGSVRPKRGKPTSA